MSATANELRSIGRQINALPRQTGRDLVRIGELLLRARQLLERGRYSPWLHNNTSLSHSWAKQAMAAARRAKRLKLEPAELAGYTISAALVYLKLDKQDRERAAQTDGRYSTLLRSRPEDTGPEAGPLAELGRRLAMLIERPGLSSVYFSVLRDTEDREDVWLSCLVHYDDGRPPARAGTHRTIHDLMAELLGETEVRQCPRCGELRPVTMFGRGRAKACLPCERIRAKKYVKGDRARPRVEPSVN